MLAFFENTKRCVERSGNEQNNIDVKN